MQPRRAIALSAITLGALALQGCIAAAIPLAAGGLVARGAGGGVGNNSTGGEVSVAQGISQGVAQGVVQEVAREPVPVTAAPALATAPSGPRIAKVDLDELPPGDVNAAPIELAGVTPGTRVPTPTRRSGLPGARDPFGPFFDYARSLTDKKFAARPSAVLRDPASLEPDRADCGAREPTLLIDLDPAEGLLDPNAAALPAPFLADDLARLRRRDVTIAWISGHSAAMAGDIRAALKAARLDPKGTDRLILMRYPDDRKQSRRNELGRNVCILAIAGDTKSDFDEVFDYARDPSATAMLETLIGRGWFLVPPLFPPQGPQT